VLFRSRRLAAIKSGQQAKGNDSEDDDIISEPLRRRMDMLLASTRQDLPGHLRQVVSLLKTEEIPIDWAMLLNDILSWESRSRRVQWRWSQAFYVGNYKKKDGAGDVS
jgi:CRISPR system Cascade subunit CasB